MKILHDKIRASFTGIVIGEVRGEAVFKARKCVRLGEGG